MNSRQFSRRAWLRCAGAGLAGLSASGWFPTLAARAAAQGGPRRHCILLWMTGGPSQLDTFDPKPLHPNGGEFKPIDTCVPGLQICQHLPQLARQADHLAIIRSLSTKEGDHGRGTYLMRTGHQPTGPIRYPTLGSLLSKELGSDDIELPNYVSIAPYQLFNQQAFSPGYLGPRYAPLTVGAVDNFQAMQAPAAGTYPPLGVDDLALPAGVDAAQAEARRQLWQSLQTSFLARHQSAAPLAHHTVYQRAVRMMDSQAAGAFDLSGEPDAVRQAYGTGRFGQGCLMARRLIERGVSFVEVSLGAFGNGSLGWDTHQNNFTQVKRLCEELDAGWGSLLHDLKQRGLLESTTIVWMGEFGRTPAINQAGGRDHYPNAWSAVLAGGGIRGGQAYGRTGVDGMQVEDKKLDVGDLLATLCQALGLDPTSQNISEIGRPIRLADGRAVPELLA